MPPNTASIGDLLQSWRRRRKISQLHLAAEAGVSQRHISFVESGRSRPSRDMVLLLAEQLAVPLRERNALLAAAGYAPTYHEQNLATPSMQAAWSAVRSILAAHEPHPAIAVDRHWNLTAANAAMPFLTQGVDPMLLKPPANVLRLSLHPDGLASRIRNFREWRAHVVQRLARQIDLSGDQVLVALLQEIRDYPTPSTAKAQPIVAMEALAGIAVPLCLETEAGTLSFLSATTIFGTATDIALSEVVIESFLPADLATAAVMRRLAEQRLREQPQEKLSPTNRSLASQSRS